jgi:hypothetical protein
VGHHFVEEGGVYLGRDERERMTLICQAVATSPPCPQVPKTPLGVIIASSASCVSCGQALVSHAFPFFLLQEDAA